MSKDWESSGYRIPECDERLQQARGLWVPPGRVLTVEVSRGATHLRDPDVPVRALDRDREDVRILSSGGTRPLRHAFGIALLADMLGQLVASEP